MNAGFADFTASKKSKNIFFIDSGVESSTAGQGDQVTKFKNKFRFSIYLIKL
jgi:hypothetical protein